MAEKTLSTIKKEENGNIVVSVTISEKDVDRAHNQVVEDLVKNADIQGFRKGKAPKKVVLEHTNQDKLKEETLRKLLPTAYMEAVQEHNLHPVVNPSIHVDKLEDKGDWTFTATTCEMPKVELGAYKEKVKEITAKSKIILPGKEEQKEPNFDEIMDAIAKSVEVKIPQMLIDQEVDRLLSQTLDEIKRLGLTLEQYMSSTGKSAEQMREEYSKRAEHDIKIELVLQKIAEEEKITVEQKEIDEAIQKAKDPQEKSYLENNAYLLANILRQQKTLDFIKNL